MSNFNGVTIRRTEPARDVLSELGRYFGGSEDRAFEVAVNRLHIHLISQKEGELVDVDFGQSLPEKPEEGRGVSAQPTGLCLVDACSGPERSWLMLGVPARNTTHLYGGFKWLLRLSAWVSRCRLLPSSGTWARRPTKRMHALRNITTIEKPSDE